MHLKTIVDPPKELEEDFSFIIFFTVLPDGSRVGRLQAADGRLARAEKKKTEVGGSRGADWTGCGWLAEGDTNRRKTEEKKEKERGETRRKKV